MSSALTFLFGTGIYTDPDTTVLESGKMFVRSKYQLSEFDVENSKATGHVMTAWEAYRSYGLDVIEEAIEKGSAILITSKHSTENSIINAKQSLQISETDIANATRMPVEMVKGAVNNDREISIHQLERLFFTLGMDERMVAFKAIDDRDLRCRLAK